jgi:prefoldin subunit 5
VGIIEEVNRRLIKKVVNLAIAIKESVTALEVDKRGRPCKYETHIETRLDDIFNWLKEGYTDYSIADQLGIHQNTWMRYRDNYSILRDLYTRARKERNTLVMNRMYAKACGEIAEVKQEKLDKEGNKVTLKSEIYTPPDVNAADLYLRNNSDDYKSAKNEGSNLTLIQNNFQLPQINSQIQQLEQQLKSLEASTSTALEVIEIE